MADQEIQNSRILVVDDEPGILQAYSDFLSPAAAAPARVSSRGAPQDSQPSPGSSQKKETYEILRASSGEEAVSIFQKEFTSGRRIAGGFFDVKMGGGIDGLQAVREIWKIDPGMNCTIVTAYQDRSINDIDHVFGSQFKDQWDYLNKPFTHAEITQKARQMVAAWNRRERLASTHALLVKSERMAAIGELARAIGHEFGNLLQAIIGKADLALIEKDPAKVQQKLETIVQAAEKASSIVRNLQSLSKGSRERGPVDLGKSIQAVISLTNHEMTKNTVVAQLEIAPCKPLIGNSGEIEQVLLNLVVNAIHAMSPKGGTVTIGLREESDAAVISVKDTGCGIAPEVLPKIFDYAFTTKGDKGSGLGLAISKEIVEAHGGTIKAKSQTGQGTEFILRFPRASVGPGATNA